MTKEELKQEAENFIIDRYKLNECYREDNVETREYMRMDVHSQYEEEYQLYLAATKELQEENAELKEKNKALDKDLFEAEKCIHWLGVKDEQLTKAKEIIRDLINLTEPTSTEEVQHWNETFRKAEKFLSEVEKC